MRNMRKTVNTRRVDKSRFFFYFSVVVFAFSLVSRVFVSNRLVVKNLNLKDQYNKKAYLEKEAARLSYEISLYSSLNAIESKASQLGFVKMSGPLKELDINVSLPVAVATPLH